jgi:hypothetical protein
VFACAADLREATIVALQRILDAASGADPSRPAGRRREFAPDGVIERYDRAARRADGGAAARS